MEYVVPLFIVLVIALIVLVGTRLLGRRNRQGEAPTSPAAAASADPASTRSRGKAGKGIDITREDAERASAKLDPETHRRVYSLIAQRQVFNAVKEYRLATRTGLREATASVAALAQFPQPTPEQTAKKQRAANPSANTVQAANALEPQLPIPELPLTVADIIAAGSAPGSIQDVPEPVAVPNRYRYRAIVSRGADVREVASTRLNEQIFKSITELALSGNYDSAATLLRDHADIGDQEALEFVRMISSED